MRVLLLDSGDLQRVGPWSEQRWDLIVNLGRSPLFASEKTPSDSRILHLDSYGQGLADARLVRDIVRAGRGVLLDHQGIDWWDLRSVAIVQESFTVVRLQRLVADIRGVTDLWCTRPTWSTNVVADLLRVPIRSFRPGSWTRAVAFAGHYAEVLHRFSLAQIKQIFFDKYDAGYCWRSRFAGVPNRCSDPVVLIPSAYANVSRMAAAYAALLPHQPFLLVATRQSARDFQPQKNVEIHDFATYARVPSQDSELSSLMERWTKLKSNFYACEGLRLLSAARVLDSFPAFFQSGLCVRDAWLQVLERQPVCSVLCGDDSNVYSRLPVMLAGKRNIPTLDFHHGALDGFYLFKNLTCDLYLAKSEMERDYLLRLCQLPEERVVIAPPATVQNLPSGGSAREGRSIVLFSEPYEIAGMRAEDVYRQLLPRLWLLASRYGRDLVIKLHPFESRSQRSQIARRVLPAEASRRLQWIEGPLTPDLFERAWFGITIESTTAIDSARNGVCCFLCRWLTLLPYGYADQYIRFGMGAALENAEQIEEIPSRLDEFRNRQHTNYPQTTDTALLQQWLTSGCREAVRARTA